MVSEIRDVGSRGKVDSQFRAIRDRGENSFRGVVVGRSVKRRDMFVVLIQAATFLDRGIFDHGTVEEIVDTNSKFKIHVFIQCEFEIVNTVTRFIRTVLLKNACSFEEGYY